MNLRLRPREYNKVYSKRVQL